jgi:hypothetical protein
MYEEMIQEPIGRSIQILDDYKGSYKVTMLMNTAYVVYGKIIEKCLEKYQSKIYDLIMKYGNVRSPIYDDQKAIVKALRNGIMHFDINFYTYGLNKNIDTIDEVTFSDYIVGSKEKSYIAFSIDSFNGFIREIAYLVCHG